MILLVEVVASVSDGGTKKGDVASSTDDLSVYILGHTLQAPTLGHGDDADLTSFKCEVRGKAKSPCLQFPLVIAAVFSVLVIETHLTPHFDQVMTGCDTIKNAIPSVMIAERRRELSPFFISILCTLQSKYTRHTYPMVSIERRMVDLYTIFFSIFSVMPMTN